MTNYNSTTSAAFDDDEDPLEPDELLEPLPVDDVPDTDASLLISISFSTETRKIPHMVMKMMLGAHVIPTLNSIWTWSSLYEYKTVLAKKYRQHTV